MTARSLVVLACALAAGPSVFTLILCTSECPAFDTFSPVFWIVFILESACFAALCFGVLDLIVPWSRGARGA